MTTPPRDAGNSRAAQRELLAAAVDAAEELYVLSQVSRRPMVRERWQRLVAAIDAVRRHEEHADG